MKRLIITYLMFSYSAGVISADELWTSWHNPPNIISIAFEDSIVWCATWDAGVVSYDTITGEQQRYTSNNGLLDDIVYCVGIDQNGYKWFSTSKGFSVFDGFQWITHPYVILYDMVIDRNNCIWGIRSKTLYRYDGYDMEEIESGNFHSIEISSSGDIWAAGNSKIFHIKDSEITEINIHKIVNARDYIQDISIHESTKKLWYACSSKIYSFDFETGIETLELDKTIIDYEGYNLIDIDATGNIWLAQTDYIALYRDGILTNYYSDYFKTRTINEIVGDDNGNVWIATSKGLLLFNDGEIKIIFDEPELYSNDISSIVIDKDNTVWCSHMDEIRIDKLSYFKDGKWSIGPMGMYSLQAVDDNNVLWGSHSALYTYEGNEVIDHTIRVPIAGFECETTSPGYIGDIYIDKNIIWIASLNDTGGDCTTSGIFTYDGSTVIPQILGDFSSVVMDSKKNVWCGSSWDGLYSFDGNGWIHYTETDGLPRHQIWHVKVDKNDIVWLSVFNDVGDDDYHSVVSYDGSSFIEYTPENSDLLKTFINIIVVDHNNTKWIGTDAGVCRFDGETWTTFTTENSGLCNNKVNAIAIEKNNTIWFGTDNGVSRYTGEVITTSVDKDDSTPEPLPVLHSYPNPFNPSTTIEFTLPESGFATLSIYNISGQKVRELAADHMTEGMHSLVWDGRDGDGEAVSSGVYITRLVAGKQVAAGRMVLMK